MHRTSGWFNICWIYPSAQIWSDLLWSFIRAVKNLHNITIGSTFGNDVFTAVYVKVLESYTYSSCKFYSDFAVLVGFIFTWIIWSANYGTRSCNLSIIWGIAINCYDICNEIPWCSMLVDFMLHEVFKRKAFVAFNTYFYTSHCSSNTVLDCMILALCHCRVVHLPLSILKVINLVYSLIPFMVLVWSDRPIIYGLISRSYRDKYRLLGRVILVHNSLDAAHSLCFHSLYML